MVTDAQKRTRMELAKRRVASELERLSKQQQPLSLPASRLVDTTKYIKKGVKCRGISKGWLEKMSRAVHVELSPGVPTHIANERNASCDTCPHVTIMKASTLHFCECCGCGKWTFPISVPGLHNIGADLESKNEHAAHVCPMINPRFSAYNGV